MARSLVATAVPVLMLLCSNFARAEEIPSDRIIMVPGFHPGEAFTYKFSVGIIDAGRARMSVGLPEDKPGGRLVAVAGDAQSSSWLAVIAKLDDKYRVVMDVASLHSTHVVSVETGVRNQRIESRLDGRRAAIEFASSEKKEKQLRRLPGVARDPVASLFLLRSARLSDGDSFQLLALDGVALYRAVVSVVGREEITRETGEIVKAVRLNVTATRIDDGGHPVGIPERHFRMWLSDDTQRIPWRVAGDTDLGEARLELTSYLPGGDVPGAVAIGVPAPPRPSATSSDGNPPPAPTADEAPRRPLTRLHPMARPIRTRAINATVAP